MNKKEENYTRDYLEWYGNVGYIYGALAAIFAIILGILLVFILPCTSAWPYQLNLSDGNLIDLNSSNNSTTNLTIYIIPQNYTLYQNLTTQTVNQYFNVTNITQLVNLTNVTHIVSTNCTNCSYANYTTVVLNNTLGIMFYDKTEADARFMTDEEFAAFKASFPTAAEFNAFMSKVTNYTVNNTAGNKVSPREGYMWGGIAVAILLGLVAIGLIIKEMQSE